MIGREERETVCDGVLVLKLVFELVSMGRLIGIMGVKEGRTLSEKKSRCGVEGDCIRKGKTVSWKTTSRDMNVVLVFKSRSL